MAWYQLEEPPLDYYPTDEHTTVTATTTAVVYTCYYPNPLINEVR